MQRTRRGIAVAVGASRPRGRSVWGVGLNPVRILFVTIPLALASCASTNYPFILPPEIAYQTDEVSKIAIRSLQDSNLSRFITAGIPAMTAERWIAKAQEFERGGDIKFLGDVIIGDHYSRDYSVPSRVPGGRSVVSLDFGMKNDRVVLENIWIIPPDPAAPTWSPTRREALPSGGPDQPN